ncbi:hypothetical protein T439DRAFT_326471 [Meredithblackwellia eburnea MCA 4105]
MSYSPSPSPGPQPASPPHYGHSPGPGSQQQGQYGSAARYNLLKLQQQNNYPSIGHHLPHHQFSYPGPSASPAYTHSNHHHNSLPPHGHHSPAPPNPQLQHLQHAPPPPHHLSLGNQNQHPSSNQQQQQSQQQQRDSNSGPLTQWQQQQVSLANLSRQANSPHHHARAAHLATRSQGSSNNAVTISDPKGASFGGPKTPFANGLVHHRKDGSGGIAILRPESAGPEGGVDRSSSVASTRTVSSIKDPLGSGGSPTTSAAVAGSADDEAGAAGKESSWTTIDLGGMNLKNVSVELFRYTFLTTLYIPHNALTSIPSAISRLINLTQLDVSSNKLSSLPPELGLLTQLRELLAFDNHITSLPPELGTLHLLDVLGVEGNPLPETMRSLIEKEGTTALISYLRDSCPVPPPPPERDWVTVEPDSFPLLNPGKPPEATFSIFTYNILCEWYATPQMYGYTPSWALQWDYRKELILQEILNYSPDIVCLQELDTEQYEEYFSEALSGQDYNGVHYPKSRARTMSGDEKRHVDGCATFYKASKFALVEQQVLEFNQIALRRPDFKKTEDVFNRVMIKDTVAVVTLLEHRDSGARLIVANAHITWDPEYRDVKLVQVAMLTDELNRISNDFAKLPPRLNLAEGYDAAPTYTNGNKIPTVICGDFNSVPESGVYEYLVRGNVVKDHPDFMNHTYGKYTSEGMSHSMSIKSAYSHVNELPFTNFTPGFLGVLDYIFYSANSLSVAGLLGEVDQDYLASSVGWPSAHFPSDHLSLLAELKFR